MIDRSVYNRIFARDKDGKAVLDNLNRVFYDRPTYTQGESERDMAFKEGQRSVVAYLNSKTREEESDG